MCSDPGSHPPIEPASHTSASGHDIGLVTGDGSRCTAYQADAALPRGAGIIVLPDYHGLTGFYRELALRFAEDGIDAVAVDYYGRTAEPPPRDPSFEPERQAVEFVQNVFAEFLNLLQAAVLWVGISPVAPITKIPPPSRPDSNAMRVPSGDSTNFVSILVQGVKINISDEWREWIIQCLSWLSRP